MKPEKIYQQYQKNQSPQFTSKANQKNKIRTKTKILFLSNNKNFTKFLIYKATNIFALKFNKKIFLKILFWVKEFIFYPFLAKIRLFISALIFTLESSCLKFFQKINKFLFSILFFENQAFHPIKIQEYHLPRKPFGVKYPKTEYG